MIPTLQLGGACRPIKGAAVGGATDPFFANVVSLLHFEGADASTTFTDVKGKVWTPAGNAQIDTAQFKYGSSSGLFDGVDDTISTPSHADFGFGTGDFTIEAWVRRTNANCVIWDSRSTGTDSMVAFCDASGFICFYDGTTKTGSIVVPSGTWSHVAWCRASGTIRMFVDGAVAYSAVYTQTMGSSRPMRLGTDIVGGADYSGWIDEFRVTNVARYTAAFTPPTAAFPDS